MKILLVGDTHGNFRHIRNVYAHAARKEVDQIIQLGDFGFGWARDPAHCLFSVAVSELALETAIPLYWLDGNHENFDFLDILLEGREPLADGTYMIEPDVYYVPRGTMLHRDGKKIMVCGGATSVDKAFRTPHESWWEQEAITYDDIYAVRRAAHVDGPADVLLTHDFPWECDIVDRHLNPRWGEGVTDMVRAGRTKVSEVLVASGAHRQFHGHLHLRYDENITVRQGSVHVTGLDKDDEMMDLCAYLLDTDEI